MKYLFLSLRQTTNTHTNLHAHLVMLESSIFTKVPPPHDVIEGDKDAGQKTLQLSLLDTVDANFKYSKPV